MIVGSKALVYNFPNLSRSIKDIDVIGSISYAEDLIDNLKPNIIKEGNGIITLIDIQNQNEVFNTKNVEILLTDNSESLKYYLDYNKNKQFASPEILFSLKKSHIHFPIFFKKHIIDYTFLYNYFNGVDKLEKITKINYKETEERIGQLKTPSLNKPVVDFFDQSKKYVQYYFIHDDIHKAVAHYECPLYLKMQKDPTIAKCDRNMWNEFSYENKCKCVLEEAYVIALERKILPSLFGKAKWINSNDSLDWALMRICTNLCSGWFREFATNNFFDIKKYINKLYVEDFLEKYNKKEICRI